ncbi:MAG: clan AA aspartic protease [Cyanobacteria bacterium J06635_11]
MILGYVNSNREAIVQLAVVGKNQRLEGFKAIIDTGYTGFLTLPSTMLEKLGLTWYMQQEGLLGDGSVCMFNVYEASVIWDGQVRVVEVNESEAAPLIGMGLLEGFELKIQSVAGGSVSITALP